MRTSMLLLLIAVAAAGCDSKKKEPPPDIIKSQRQVMDKAKAVGDVLQQSADERREQADQK